MAIPTKGARKIVVDGSEYRWLIRKKPTYSQGAFSSNMVVVVELNVPSSCTLRVTLLVPRGDNWLDEPSTPITPKNIEALIKDAQADGWQPDEKGGVFEYAAKT